MVHEPTLCPGEWKIKRKRPTMDRLTTGKILWEARRAVEEVYQQACDPVSKGEWPQTFKEAFCGHFGCAPERYEMSVFWRALFRHALPFAWLIHWLSPSYFEEDLYLIREVGAMSNSALFKSEVNYFYGRNQRHKSWTRTTFRVRVSGNRMLRLQRRLFKATVDVM